MKILSELSKIRISLLVTLSTATGFMLAADKLSGGIAFPVMGVFLLACGSSALNQFQEKEIDKLMLRTGLRPIPSGRLSPRAAWLIALFLLLFGFSVLFFKTNSAALCLGLFSVLWYNGVYTYLKKKSAFAVIPGALIGAIPPAVGWVSGGGYLLDPKILAIAFFFFIWQIPHFWLLLLCYGKDYERAGIPSLTRIFTSRQLKRITFIWILAAMATCLLIPLFGIVTSFYINLFLLASVLWLVISATRLLKKEGEEFTFSPAFREINLYALWVISMLSLDRLLNFIHISI